APRAYGFVGHISHQDKISATRQARRAHPQATQRPRTASTPMITARISSPHLIYTMRGRRTCIGPSRSSAHTGSRLNTAPCALSTPSQETLTRLDPH
ncbi:hypothetical protein BD779DRAFT_1588748, partial [Infundibulicybe gibba]